MKHSNNYRSDLTLLKDVAHACLEAKLPAVINFPRCWADFMARHQSLKILAVYYLISTCFFPGFCHRPYITQAVKSLTFYECRSFFSHKDLRLDTVFVVRVWTIIHNKLTAFQSHGPLGTSIRNQHLCDQGVV